MSKIPYPKYQKILLFVLVSLLLSSCAKNISQESWPQNMPKRQIFVESFNEQAKLGQNDNSLSNHLVWIKRFYQGSIIYPLGWNRMTEMLVDTLDDPATAKDVEPRMRALGLDICLEWAKNNSVRKIDSAAVATWGNALRTASEEDEQSEFITKVESDVQALLDGSLDLKMINRERYYPPEDYDNF